MGLSDAFRYDGKRALVVGGATGMGGATVDLLSDSGADVVGMDFAPIDKPGVTAIHVDLGDRASIDAAVDALEAPIDALFLCAGVADGTPGIERINFIGHRHMVERMLAAGMLGRGAAIGFISSAAGLGWESSLDELKELLAISDWDESVAWVEQKGWADYFHMKQAVCAYVASQAHPLLKQGIRINAICPGPTETPLALANKDMWLGFGADYRADTGIEASTPLEQAYPLVYLCSDAARSISGQTVVSDVGYMASGVTGSFPDATAIANMLLGRG
jgi:NAD(P)-dependent dehydrogenase (short-subunit alcohol dehydrogenase family)